MYKNQLGLLPVLRATLRPARVLRMYPRTQSAAPVQHVQQGGGADRVATPLRRACWECDIVSAAEGDWMGSEVRLGLTAYACGTRARVRAQVRSYVGAEKLPAALYGADLVLIPAGVPRKPGMTRDDLFNINAGAPRASLGPNCDRGRQAWLRLVSCVALSRIAWLSLSATQGLLPL
jgi:hypothetical protein